MGMELSNFEYLTEDRKVQKVIFDVNDIIVILLIIPMKILLHRRSRLLIKIVRQKFLSFLISRNSQKSNFCNNID
jgi:hypothetical protein